MCIKHTWYLIIVPGLKNISLAIFENLLQVDTQKHSHFKIHVWWEPVGDDKNTKKTQRK